MPAYATINDLTSLGLRSNALAGIPQASLDAALDAASRLADSYLQARYQLPLSAWGEDLRRCVAVLAAYDVMAVRGFAPEGVDEHLRLRAEDAIRWLEGVARGLVTPVGIVDATPSVRDEGMHIHTSSRRWP